MSIAEPFIRRPVMTTLVMLGVLLFGVAAFGLLRSATCPTWTSRRSR
jgi:HAE1 family hydrophobic/amphiphilic exporter-1